MCERGASGAAGGDCFFRQTGEWLQDRRATGHEEAMCERARQKKRYFVAKKTLETKKTEAAEKNKTVKLEIIGEATGNCLGVGANER